jgi:glycosyltransferase involved in cell wall biosynthesis
MVIAVNTRFLLDKGLEGCGHFTAEIFSRLASRFPENRFVFILDRPYSRREEFPPNIEWLVLPPPARHPLLWKYWFDFKIPRLLKRLKADLFISADGLCSLRTRVPQCLVVHDLGFLHFPSTYKNLHAWYLKNQTPKWIRKAASIATVSEFSRKDILDTYQLQPEKVEVIYNGVREVFKPLPYAEKQKIRDRYTDGNEYFLYAGAIHPRKNLVNLLKAFSLFKKRLQSNHRLVLAGRMAWKNNEFEELLSSYKYRNDVVLAGYVPDDALAELMAAAWAFVYPSLFEGFGVPVAEAMKCGTPVLTSGQTAMVEAAGEAGLYFNPADPRDISGQLMRIYKDEELRSLMIAKGFEQVKLYDWNLAADQMWNCMMKALKS